MSVRLDKVLALDRQTERQICHNSTALCMHCMLMRDRKRQYYIAASMTQDQQSNTALHLITAAS